MIQRPPMHTGMRHLALYVTKLDECVTFYTDLLGMEIEWQPDMDNVYLTSGHDNLALHRAPQDAEPAPHQRLDHFGFIINDIDDVDRWYDYFCRHGVKIAQALKTHRDGARSFYCYDPDGNLVQIIYHPPLAKT